MPELTELFDITTLERKNSYGDYDHCFFCQSRVYGSANSPKCRIRVPQDSILSTYVCAKCIATITMIKETILNKLSTNDLKLLILSPEPLIVLVSKQGARMQQKLKRWVNERILKQVLSSMCVKIVMFRGGAG